MRLDELLTTSRQHGWASTTMSLWHLQFAAKQLGWTEAPTRRNGPAYSTLTPQTELEAHPRSISTVSGLGEQALHTDGAHQFDVPDVVILHSEDVNPTPTRIWQPPTHRPWDALQHGVFVVSNGQSSFLTTAADDCGLRFDPHCMTPADARARIAATFLATATDVQVHNWDVPDKLLLLRNREVLHGRAAIADPGNRVLTRIAFHTRKDQ